jgi:uncharacterized membrane protein
LLFFCNRAPFVRRTLQADFGLNFIMLLFALRENARRSW